jgi:hypothetical protein
VPYIAANVSYSLAYDRVEGHFLVLSCLCCLHLLLALLTQLGFVFAQAGVYTAVAWHHMRAVLRHIC